jgi:hypothetical protein
MVNIKELKSGDRVAALNSLCLRGVVVGFDRDMKQVRVKWDEMSGAQIRPYESWVFPRYIWKV